MSIRWQNWAGYESCSPQRIEHPSSVDELKTAVANAKRDGLKVSTVGSGHSFTDVACTDGCMFDIDRMNRVLNVDREAGLVRVEAGIKLHELNRRLDSHGLALRNLGDVDRQSIAGAISTSTHGTGAKLGNLSTQLHAIELVTASGEVVECSAEKNSEIFNAARVGIGALGVISAVTLKCVPSFTLHGVDVPKPINEVLANLDGLVDNNQHYEFFTFPHSDLALTRTNNIVDMPPQPHGRTRTYLEEVVLNNKVFGLACGFTRRFPKTIPTVNRLVSKAAGSNKVYDKSYKVFASPRLVKFIEMEYAIPRADVTEAVRRVRQMVVDHGHAVNFPLEVRFSAPDDAFLSTAFGRETAYVAVHVSRGMEWKPFFHDVESIMNDYDGRPHWGKQHFQTAETLKDRYPEWDSFQAVRKQLDPDGLFTNAYQQRVLGDI